MAPLAAVVVVPARDEADQIEGCLRALAAQTLARDAFEVILVLDDCRDDTEGVATAAASWLGLQLTTMPGPGTGTGGARRAGMEWASARLLQTGTSDGLIASTDADSRPAADWLSAQLAHLGRGAVAVAGRIDLDPEEARALPAATLAARQREAAVRLARVRLQDPDAAHHHFAGASLGVAAATYRAVGGIAPHEALEDEAFAARLARHGVPVLRPGDVRVMTSARTDGRASHGLSVDLAVADWRARRRWRAEALALDALSAAKPDHEVTVIIPTRECGDTIAGVLAETVRPARDAGLVDEVIVVDAGSADGTGRVAAEAGARVLQQDELVPEVGPARGKGDAMWRALQASGGDVVCFLDGDTRDPHPDHLLGVLGPLLLDDSVMLVKGAFTRTFELGGQTLADEGGRVTELMARPLINLHEPRLAGFRQPLAGEFAARRWLLESLPFPVGYGVEIAVLIDALRLVGLDGLAECDLGHRQNAHQPLRALGEMAYAVLAAVTRRLPAGTGPGEPAAAIGERYVRPWDDGAVAHVQIAERAPLAERALTPEALS